MALFFKIIKGTLRGQVFEVRPGETVGRTAAAIVISDQKISSIHARIDADPSGGFCLVDLSSANGLWLDEQRVKKISLLHGVRFRIGQTIIEIIDEAWRAEADHAEAERAQAAQAEVAQAAASPKPQAETNIASIVERLPRDGWRSRLALGVSELLAENPHPPPIISAFKNPVIVEFIAGSRTGELALLGYGPRRFGYSNLDVDLLDPTIPGLAFEIESDNGYPKFVSHYKDFVELNGKPHTWVLLKTGDIIGVGKTKIRISFYDGNQ